MELGAANPLGLGLSMGLSNSSSLEDSVLLGFGLGIAMGMQSVGGPVRAG